MLCTATSVSLPRAGGRAGIATGYGLGSPGIESRWGGEIFRTRPNRTWGPPSLLYNEYGVSFPGVKRLGRGVNHSPPSSYSYTSALPLGLHDVFYGELYFLPQFQRIYYPSSCCDFVLIVFMRYEHILGYLNIYLCTNTLNYD